MCIRDRSITILKDAAGTALYGSRASNGVLVFETKKPKPGALTLSYSGNVGISVPDLSDYNLMNASEKLEYERDVYKRQILAYPYKLLILSPK